MILCLWGNRHVFLQLVLVQTGTATMETSVDIPQIHRNHSTMLVGMEIGAASMEISVGVLKTKK